MRTERRAKPALIAKHRAQRRGLKRRQLLVPSLSPEIQCLMILCERLLKLSLILGGLSKIVEGLREIRWHVEFLPQLQRLLVVGLRLPVFPLLRVDTSDIIEQQ